MDPSSTSDSLSTQPSTVKEAKDNVSPLLPKDEKVNKKVKKRPTERFQNLGDAWLSEWSCLALSILSFAGLVAILVKFNNKLLTEWKWSTASINTVVAILATISKASLAMAVSTSVAQLKWNWFSDKEEPLIDFDRIDAASRGVWGSFRLMKTVVRRPHWIMLGALTTIIFPAYGPFLQALIGLESEDFVQAKNGSWSLFDSASQGNGSLTDLFTSGATIGQCSNLSVGSYEEDASSGVYQLPFGGSDGNDTLFPQYDYTLQGVDFGMAAAVWNGLSDQVQTIDLWPKFVCSSGNCTWAPYTSLAVCSKCNNVSDHMVESKGKIVLRSHQYASSSDPDSTLSYISYPGVNAQNGTFTMYTIPESGLNISNYDGPLTTLETTTGAIDYATYMTAKAMTNPGLTLTFQQLRTMILAVQILKVDDSWKNNETWWEDTKIRAYECSLSFCVAQYNSSVEQGVLSETIEKTWHNRSKKSFQYLRNVELDEAYTEWSNYSLDLAAVARTDLQLFIPADDQAALPRLRGQTFNISQPTIVGLNQVLLSGFGVDDSAADIPSVVYPATGANSSVPDFGLALGSVSDVTTSFSMLSLSLSKWIRNKATGKDVSGLVRQEMVVIKVSWYFLILPLVTLCMGLAVVLLAIVDTKRKGLPAWKDDVLVPLGYGTERPLHDKLEAVTTGKELFQVARDVKVSMRSEGGLRERKLGLRKGDHEA